MCLFVKIYYFNCVDISEKIEYNIFDNVIFDGNFSFICVPDGSFHISFCAIVVFHTA